MNERHCEHALTRLIPGIKTNLTGPVIAGFSAMKNQPAPAKAGILF